MSDTTKVNVTDDKEIDVAFIIIMSITFLLLLGVVLLYFFAIR